MRRIRRISQGLVDGSGMGKPVAFSIFLKVRNLKKISETGHGLGKKGVPAEGGF
ncbi:MAG: hypothetical protein M0Z61_13105 [Nitrospiraceae bacterium]|nr:hypothetical protein [Nitrospiraceae bacterium]